MSTSLLRLLRHRRLFSTASAAAVSPSSILSPSDPSAVLTAQQKSLAAYRLLKQLPRSPPPASGAADPSAVLSICSAASLSPSVHLDRATFSLAVTLLSPSPASVRSLVSDLLLSVPSERHVSHAIVLFGQAGLLDDALSTFKSNPSTKSLNSLLLAAVIAADHPAAARFFAELPSSYNVTPDLNTYNTMIKSFSESGSTRSAYSLLEEMRKQNIKPNATTFSHAITGFYHEQRFDEVKNVMELMKKHGCNPYSLAVYNVRIKGLCKLRKSAEANDLYRVMLAKKIKPNWVTMNSLILGFCREGNLEEAKRLYQEMGKRGIVDVESELYFTLIHYLCQGGDFEAALGVCKDAMAKKWVPCFKTMKTLVEGLAQASKVEEAKELVEQMKGKFPGKAEAWKEVEEGFPQ